MPDHDALTEGLRHFADASRAQLDKLRAEGAGPLQRRLGIGYGAASFLLWAIKDLPALIDALKHAQDRLIYAESAIACLWKSRRDLQVEAWRLRGHLAEARMWARHGYEIGQRSCTWTDDGIAPRWLTHQGDN